MFRKISNQVSFPDLEKRVLNFWKDQRIYDQSLQRREGGPQFVFFEGPPTANGLPHPGHCLTRAIKDLFPRYRTMRGDYCQRKAGWDTHGLPVEMEVCKELGIHSKEDIENYGVEPFIQKCQQSVWRYMRKWEELTERLGFWIHLDQAYVTYHQGYVESVWWSLKTLFERGDLYQGHKIVWWWAQGGTALSSGEVGDGYREVADPSVYVAFPLVDRPDTALLVWTTTPWTLPSNQYVAVGPDIAYATVVDTASGQRLIVAADLVETLAKKRKTELQVESTCHGRDLLGLRYRPPFQNFSAQFGETVGNLLDGGQAHLYWRVLAADFVTTTTGTGLVHQAPAFGEVDHEVLIAEQARFAAGHQPQLFCPVAADGKFTPEVPEFQGQWVKDADKAIIRLLKEREVLWFQEQYLHDYPFCWRADKDPLIQYPRRSWFIRTTKYRDQMLANNQQIHWLPDHIKNGRFGNFLADNVDWALSRERFWGTPLPIWVCAQTGQMESIGSYAELLAKPGLRGVEVWEAAKSANPELPEDLKVHKPYIDALTYDSPFAPGARMQRVPEVIDCWYDSGAMPFAQWGYPQTGAQAFAQQFPAHFISEALDQTRGWFYSLTAISTMLFGSSEVTTEPPATSTALKSIAYPHPFRNCVVLGLMLSEWWESKDGKQLRLNEDDARRDLGPGFTHHVGKMSKQKRNYREPFEIFDNYGADVLRWYFFASQAPWNSINYSEQAIKNSIPEFMLRLWNTYSFFCEYAVIDGFNPANGLLGLELSGAAKPVDLFSLDQSGLQQLPGYTPIAQRGELDRWIMSELHQMLDTVVASMDRFENFPAAQAINQFLDSLSNWYVRRSRDRFWSGELLEGDKLEAYWTLYECLVTVNKVIAPFVPFVAEEMWGNLAGVFDGQAAVSVHLTDFPLAVADLIDRDLSQRMAILREIASLGLRARTEAKLRVRQPLSKVEVVLNSDLHVEWLESHREILEGELNVKSVHFTTSGQEYVNYEVIPNFPRLGPRYGKSLPQIKAYLAQGSGGHFLQELQTEGAIRFSVGDQAVELTADDVQVRLNAKPGWAAAQGRTCVVVLSTELDEALIQEGQAKDVVRLIQNRRKEMGLEYTDRIRVGWLTDHAPLRQAIEVWRDHIAAETLAIDVQATSLTDTPPLTCTVDSAELTVFVQKA
jgi:isoleucyl-tRNA synthetase